MSIGPISSEEGRLACRDRRQRCTRIRRRYELAYRSRPFTRGRYQGESAAPSDRRTQAGFTLIELMVVITILALLVALVAPKLVGRTDEARVTAAKAQLKNIESALELYKLDNGVYPTTEQGLDALVTEPTTPPLPINWKKGGYLPKVPNDPWKRPYIYISPGIHNPDYDLLSYGADGEPGGEGTSRDLDSRDLD
jgi:general secretion pathway protein G